jgi:hypothetical protein
MQLFDVLIRYFWLVCLVFNLQYFPARVVRERRNSDAEFAASDRTLRFRVFLWMCVPWIVMGAGQLIGGVPHVWNYFRPQEGNVWVALFFAAVIVLWLALAYWVYVGNGAMAIVDHQLIRANGLKGPIALTPSRVKLFVALTLVGGIAGMTMMFSMNVPLPVQFR